MTVWIKKAPERTEYCRIEKTDTGSLKVVSGIVGFNGKEQLIEPLAETNVEDWKNAKLDSLIRKGFVQVKEEDYSVLVIQHPMNGFGSVQDFELKERFEKQLDLLLYTNGLGFMKGGLIKSGYWEVLCFVLDAAKAKELIKYAIRYTSFERIELYELPKEGGLPK